MRKRREIEDALIKTESDERLGYDPAPVTINAPLALIQVELHTRANTLRWMLSLPQERHGQAWWKSKLKQGTASA